MKLKDVTIVCVDSVNTFRALNALERCLTYFDFGGELFIQQDRAGAGIYCIERYSEFMIKELPYFIKTDFALIVQFDGFIVNPKAWTDEFLKYDYIGAPWWYDELNVGNGGFSLRSRKFMEACSKFDYGKKPHPEDDVICRQFRNDFESMGFKWAPENVASKFSWEGNVKYPNYNGAFGFHGRNNLRLFI